jgi:hypothetical protein
MRLSHRCLHNAAVEKCNIHLSFLFVERLKMCILSVLFDSKRGLNHD